MDSHTSLAVATNLWERSVPTGDDVIYRNNNNIQGIVNSFNENNKLKNQLMSQKLVKIYIKLLFKIFAFLIFTVGFIALAKYIVDFFFMQVP